MTAIKSQFLSILTVAIIALLAGAPSLAQTNSSRVGSDLSLVVDGGSQVAIMPVIAETAQSDLLVYNFATGEVQFSAGVVPLDGGALLPQYDDPLFCFDLGVPQSPVSLQVTDPNGHVIIDNFDLQRSLDYILDVEPMLSVDPSANQQCFFRSDLGQFGLFGQENLENAPSGLISRDRFEVSRSLNLKYEGVPEFVALGETVTYDLVVTNTGSGDLSHIGLQELFPENLGVYTAALHSTSWTCAPTGGAVCPAGSEDPSALRFQDFNTGGIDIPGEEDPGLEDPSLTFTITRTVDANSATGEVIRLHAGVAADPISSDVPSAVAESQMTVTGQSAALAVSATDAVADGADSSTITVTVLDASQNPVPDVTVNFDSASSDLAGVTPASGISGSNGQVVFDSGATTNAGDYTVSFTAGTLAGNGVVSFLAGDPAAMNATTTLNNVVANGTDAVEFTVVVLDANGNLKSGAAVDVSDNGGLTSITPTTAFTDVDGEATFTATSSDTGTFTVVFAVSGAGTDPTDASFVAGSFDTFAFVQQPTNAVASEPINPAVTVELLDAFGNRLTGDNSTNVELELRGPALESLGSKSVVNGLATFSDIIIQTPDTGYYLRATVPTLTNVFVDSQTFNVD